LWQACDVSGNEVEKAGGPESSAALSVNTFGWFIERPGVLPRFSGVDADYPATLLDVEYCFPLWRAPPSALHHHADITTDTRPMESAIIDTPRK
jgi:hypothetical protein